MTRVYRKGDWYFYCAITDSWIAEGFSNLRSEEE